MVNSVISYAPFSHIQLQVLKLFIMPLFNFLSNNALQQQGLRNIISKTQVLFCHIRTT